MLERRTPIVWARNSCVMVKWSEFARSWHSNSQRATRGPIWWKRWHAALVASWLITTIE